jgi:hypothetical protein
MTIIETPRTTSIVPGGFTPVALDLYRDIHKGIRTELFAVTAEAGRLDPADREGRAALAANVDAVVALLVSHAEHEDTAVQPAIEANLPDLAERIERDHLSLEAWMEGLQALAADAAAAPAGRQRDRVQHLYLELGSFTGAYLHHQDIEERVVMPALEAAIGIEAVGGIHHAIISSIPPAEMASSLALMLPAMNLDDRAELLGGMRAGAPAEVFDGVWSLAGSVLDPVDHQALARRLAIG